MRLNFDKYEGLGNDFIVVEAAPSQLHPHAQALCDRHFGVGADGVLAVHAPHSAGARATMTVLNADGSKPEMCGNGLRCVALHLARRDDAPAINYLVDTDAGAFACAVERDGERGAHVRTALGKGSRREDHEAVLDGERMRFQCVSMGNPHAIVFDRAASIEQIDRWGPQVSAAFAQGSNVEFAWQRGSGRFDLIVWERGVGRTLACGTGAAATAVAAVLSGKAEYDTPLGIHLPGGRLELTVNRALDVQQRGPARHVYSGIIEVP
ncbi:MAG: diaminopimelate epimerase [Polyangiaceae bacterium]